MAHFAQLDNNNIVQTVIVVANDDCGGGDYPASEPVGQAFLASLGFTGVWQQTSYNNNIRKQYAGIGFTYDTNADVFVAPQPFASLALDSNHDWQPPTPKPEGDYEWNEEELEWVAI